jgi:hypothetical protein
MYLSPLATVFFNPLPLIQPWTDSLEHITFLNCENYCLLSNYQTGDTNSTQKKGGHRGEMLLDFFTKKSDIMLLTKG